MPSPEAKAGGAHPGQCYSTDTRVGIPALPQTGFLLFPDCWYPVVSGSNYSAWMTLYYDIEYYPSCPSTPVSCSSRWNSDIVSAFANWNSQDTTVYYSGPNTIGYFANDVHVRVYYDSLDPFVGLDRVRNASDFDCLAHDCSPVGTANNTWQREIVYINDQKVPSAGFPAQANVSNSHRAAIAHELGHGLSLRHPDGDQPNNACVSPASVMDPDYVFTAACSNIYYPASMDICGVNNVLYDPNWGYSGC